MEKFDAVREALERLESASDLISGETALPYVHGMNPREVRREAVIALLDDAMGLLGMALAREDKAEVSPPFGFALHEWRKRMVAKAA